MNQVDDDKPPIPSPFSKDYVSQIAPIRPIQFRIPALKKQPRFLKDTISTEGKGKQFHLKKTSI